MDVRLFLKREDLTGLALGGNKTRMFEFLLGDAVARGADVVVAGAGAQSNYCRLLAAALPRRGGFWQHERFRILGGCGDLWISPDPIEGEPGRDSAAEYPL